MKEKEFGKYFDCQATCISFVWRCGEKKRVGCVHTSVDLMGKEGNSIKAPQGDSHMQ